jgi:hypothetical protein
MTLTAASLLATAISFAEFNAGAAWIVAPWMRRQPLAVALAVPLWIHPFGTSLCRSSPLSTSDSPSPTDGRVGWREATPPGRRWP